MKEFLHIYQPGFADLPGSYESPTMDINSQLIKLGDEVYLSHEDRTYKAHEYFFNVADYMDEEIGSNFDSDDCEDIVFGIYYIECKNIDIVQLIRDIKINTICSDYGR